MAHRHHHDGGAPAGRHPLRHRGAPYGGDTLFASQYLAYESLSDGMKRLLEGLRAVHSDRKVAGPQAGMNAYRATKVREEGWEETVSTHPVVRTHPETGRKLLFVNHSYTIRFEGMTDAESAPLLGFLLEHGHRPEFTCRFGGPPARSRSGTTAVSSTWPCTTRGASAGSCAASRSRATSRSRPC